MRSCNATITTVELAPHTGHPNSQTILKNGRWWLVMLHRLECDGIECAAMGPHQSGVDADEVSWWDQAPGASPHRVPMYSDEEYSEALAAFQAHHDGDVDRAALASALVAAARVRQEGNDHDA